MVEVSFGQTEIYHVLYEIEKGSPNHDYSHWEQLHEQNLQGDGARVDVTINIDPEDYDEFDAETIRQAEMYIAACLDKELSLIDGKHRHSDDDSGFF